MRRFWFYFGWSVLGICLTISFLTQYIEASLDWFTVPTAATTATLLTAQYFEVERSWLIRATDTARLSGVYFGFITLAIAWNHFILQDGGEGTILRWDFALLVTPGVGGLAWAFAVRSR